MTRIASAIFVFVLAAFLSGCVPASIRPLYTDADLKNPISEPRIEGEWVSPDLDKVGTGDDTLLKWKIVPPELPVKPYSAYRVEYRPGRSDPGKGDEFSRYDVRLVAIGDKLFFDAEFAAVEEGQVKIGSDDYPGLVGAHVIGRIWVHSDYLRIAMLDSRWMEDNLPASFQEFKSDDAIITASTQEVRDVLLRNSDNGEAMSNVLYLCHPGVDCAGREFDDELSRGLKEDDFLKQAAKFFLTRGNYDRALAVQRLRLESKPHDFSIREDLCRTLLFKKDFATARIEFAATQKLAEEGAQSATESGPRDDLDRAAARAAEGAVWSYFIEGDYSGTVKSFASYKGARGFRSANPILLSYFSLLHLGKKTEAVAFLKEQSSKFQGPSEDHLLLLGVQGRLIDGVVSSVPLKGEALQRSYLYTALAWIGNGNTNNARANLEYALDVSDAPKDGLPTLAARVELDRLGPSAKK
jgi:tetratricopeptide (TPR) repeat protein